MEFAVGYSEPNAGSDAASMRLKAERGERDGKPGWILNGQKTWTTSAHFAEWYWLGTAPTRRTSTAGITLMLVPLDQPGVTIKGIWTMGDERTNEVFIEDVFVPDDYVVGEVEPRLPVHLAGARPRALHAVHVLADQPARSICSSTTCAPNRDGQPLRDDPVIRQRIARARRPTPRSPVSRPARGRGVDEGREGARRAAADHRVVGVQALRDGVLPPASPSASMDIGGPGTQLRVRTKTRRWRVGPSRRTATP